MNSATKKALDYLSAQQAPGGNFTSWSSSDPSSFSPHTLYATTFVPALMLSALSQSANPIAQAIQSRLAHFLLRQKSSHWSFGYWARHSTQAKDQPYPDDLDDTFCSLSALWLHDASMIDQSALAHIIKLLIATESRPGGPYHTWLVPATAPKEWRDIDIAVNANVAYFLQLAVAPLPALTEFMEESIQSESFESPYYPNQYPILYYLARAYRGPKCHQLAQYIQRSNVNGHWGTPLHTALAVTSLLRLGYKDGVEPAVTFLLTSQAPDGSWPAEAFCFDPQREGEKFYCGSPELTTAFVVEALEAYRQSHLTQKRLVEPPQPHRSLRQEIVTTAEKNLRPSTPELRPVALRQLQRITDLRMSHEIILLPRLFYDSLRERPHAPQQLFINLGVASLYGWSAYTIYDDLLDGEANYGLLPVANTLARYSVRTFERTLPHKANFRKLIQTTFDRIENANLWEMSHCRFTVRDGGIEVGVLPDYGRRTQLAQRSLGLTLAPLAVLEAIGIPSTTPAARAILRALSHYIIARQLNDDAHDWRLDLQAGRITYVVNRVLQNLALQPGIYQLDSLTSQVERYFWHTTLPEICRTISHHTRLSRRALQQSKLLATDNILDILLHRIDASVDETLQTLRQTESFLKSYDQKS